MILNGRKATLTKKGRPWTEKVQGKSRMGRGFAMVRNLA